MRQAWSLPLAPYLGNGSESFWHEMMTAFSEISRLTQTLQREFTVADLSVSGEVRELAEHDRYLAAVEFDDEEGAETVPARTESAI